MIALALFVAAGCGSSGLSTRPPVETLDTGGADGDPVGIDALDPAWSLPDEETAVTITGHGFIGKTVVEFGRSGVTASVVDDETLVVTAPAAGVETTVDVIVTSEAGSATLEDGFTWTEEEPEDTGGDDTGGDTGNNSGAGKVGGLLQFQLVQIACPSCLNLTSSLQVSAQAAFHTPTRSSWVSWLPAVGTCIVNPTPVAAADTYQDAGTRMWLEYGPNDHPEVSVALTAGADGLFAAEGLSADDFVRTAGYRVEVAGGGDVPAFTEENAVYTPDSISSLTPADMLYTEPRDAFAAQIRKSRADFTWSSSGGTAEFAVVIDVYSASGNPLAQVMCYDADTGGMRVPAAYLDYPAGSLLVIGMYRYAVAGYLRPDDGSTVQTVTTFGVLGTGILSN
ncbi:MAG: hypothetical protein EXR71_02535 [Myxococcales bacterium]|nr:hypothetical protein [Myxococcales bacterium]